MDIEVIKCLDAHEGGRGSLPTENLGEGPMFYLKIMGYALYLFAFL
jgi:hypothetical protein